MTLARASAPTRPHLGSVRLLVLAALGMFVAHDTIFVAQYGLGAGYEAAMDRTAHGYWPAFVLFTMLVAGVGALIAARVLAGLGRMARGLPPSAPRSDRPAYWAEVRHLWPRLVALVLLGLMLQENLEHALEGEGWPGPWVLAGPDYPLSIPSILLVSGLLAAIGGWFQWRRDILIARLRVARAAGVRRSRPGGRVPLRHWALLAALLANRWAILRHDDERAPPLAGAA